MIEVFIRSYRPDDLDAVIDMYVGAIRGVAARDYTPAQIEAWSQVDRGQWAEKRLSRPTWVAVLGNEIIGFADLEPDGHLDMLYVHSSYQGRGVATALVASVESYARDERMTRLFTEASLTAQAFFTARGFHTMERQTVHRRGRDFINFCMEKDLLPN